VSLASAVSLNIETPGAANLARLSSRKDYLRDIIDPLKHISQLTARGSRFEKVKQTTQFIVGPAGESDSEIVKYMWGLYYRLRLHRIYFSAYQQGAGDASLPVEGAGWRRGDHMFVRSIALPGGLPDAAGFTDSDILFDGGEICLWRRTRRRSGPSRHPEFFLVPVESRLPAEACCGCPPRAGDGQWHPATAADATDRSPRRPRRRRGSAAEGASVSGLLNILIAKGPPRSIIRRLDLGLPVAQPRGEGVPPLRKESEAKMARRKGRCPRQRRWAGGLPEAGLP
jgi:hypothetical protein